MLTESSTSLKTVTPSINKYGQFFDISANTCAMLMFVTVHANTTIIMKGNSEFQLPVSENKGAILFSIRVHRPSEFHTGMF